MRVRLYPSLAVLSTRKIEWSRAGRVSFVRLEIAENTSIGQLSKSCEIGDSRGDGVRAPHRCDKQASSRENYLFAVAFSAMCLS